MDPAPENVSENALDLKLSMPVRNSEETAAARASEIPQAADTPQAAQVPQGEETGRRKISSTRRKSGSSRVYAGFFVRLTAFLLDKVIVGLPLILLRMIFMVFLPGSSAGFLAKKIFFSFTVLDVILYLLTIVYFVLLTYYFGGTLGKKMMKLRVVSAEDRKPTFFEIAFREIIGRYLSTFILYIGYLMIGAGDQKEALHDFLADTRVVYELAG